MKQGIIDIGSNSIRLTVYEVEGHAFRILFREKVMAGLASYVENGALSAEGIESACSGLLEFRATLETLKIENVAVFATASLRNISNTERALAIIHAATGFSVDVISGEEEALLGYTGVMEDLRIESGAFLDVGGASTEVVSFEEGVVTDSASFPIGSLSLYKRCVKNILPGEGSLQKLQGAISQTIDPHENNVSPRVLVVGVGGTARATLKLARHSSNLPKNRQGITAEQLDELTAFLCSGTKDATNLILRHEADRIHTLIPGILILQHAFHLFSAKQLIVSKYGVREGYLCQKILNANTLTPKTEN